MKKLLFIGVLLATSAWGQYVPTVFTPNAVVGGTTLVKVGTFNKKTSGAPDNCTAPCTQAVTGIGFTPKAVIFWSGPTDANTDATPPSSGLLSNNFGFVTGASAAVGGAWTLRAALAGNTGRYWHSKAVALISNASPPIVLAECDLASLDSDGFTLTCTTNSTSATRIHYLAIGGTDVTNVLAKEYTASTSTGDVAYTGIGFQPDMLLFVSTSLATADGTTPVANAAWSFGAATNTGAACANANQWAIAQYVVDGSGTVRADYMRTDAALLGIKSTGTEDFRACLKTMGADGFTLNWPTAAPSAYKFAVLAIKGPHVAVGNWGKPTGAAPVTDSTVTGLAFAPAGAMVFSNQNTTSTSVKNGMFAAFGAFTSTSARSSYWAGKVINTDPGRFGDVTNKVMSFVTCGTDCATSTSLTSQADVASMDSGGWTWTWATNDANAWQLGYWTLGH